MSKEKTKKREKEEIEKEKCGNKVKYLTRKEARAKAKELNTKYGFCQNEYRCPYCGYFHLKTDKEKLTKRKEKEIKKENKYSPSNIKITESFRQRS